jgi:hypothetical protein
LGKTIRFEELNCSFEDAIPLKEGNALKRPEAVVVAGSPSALLQASNSLAVEWEQILLTPNVRAVNASNVMISAAGLATLWEVVARLVDKKKLKASLHLCLEKCELSEDCCVLLLKPPRNVALVSLDHCVFPALFKIKFSCKLHIQVK